MLRDVPENISRAAHLLNGEPVEMFPRDNELILILPEKQRQPIDTVVVVSP